MKENMSDRLDYESINRAQWDERAPVVSLTPLRCPLSCPNQVRKARGVSRL